MHPIDLNLAFKKKNIMPPRQTLSLLDYDHATVHHTVTTNKCVLELCGFVESVDLISI